MRSIHALSCDGMEKLNIGAPMTTTSAARNSLKSSSVSAASSRTVAFSGGTLPAVAFQT